MERRQEADLTRVGVLLGEYNERKKSEGIEGICKGINTKAGHGI